MTSATQTITQQLDLLQWEDLPQRVIHQAKRSLINVTGLSVHSARHSSVNSLLSLGTSTHDSIGASGTVVGRHEKVPLHIAALVNGYTAHLEDFDDTHLSSMVHPSASVYSAALALGEWKAVSGKRYLTSFVLGCEFEIRMAEALGPSHFERGWHVTSTTGSFGATVASGKILKLSDGALANAIGTAGSLTAGTMSALGTLAKPFHPGKAAYNGVITALLAGHGFTGSEEIDGRRSFLQIASDMPQITAVTNKFGTEWRFLDNTYKPYPCGIVSHPAIECACRLYEETRIMTRELEKVTVRVHPDVLKVMGNREPQTGLEAKFSVHHAVAVALTHGRVRPSDFHDLVLRDSVLSNLRQQIEIVPDTTLPRDAASMTANTFNGRHFSIAVDHAIGSVHRPMSDSDLEHKFIDLCTSSLESGMDPPMTVQKAKQLLDKLWSLEKLKSIRELDLAVKW